MSVHHRTHFSQLEKQDLNWIKLMTLEPLRLKGDLDQLLESDLIQSGTKISFRLPCYTGYKELCE